MNYKTILITGGAGFVGSNLAVSFKNKYPKVNIIALDNLKRRGSELNLKRLKDNGIIFTHADIRNPEDLCPASKIDLLIECSAEPSVLSGLKGNPRYIIGTNLTGTVNCLELARMNKADVIFLSTSRVYPYAQLNKIEYSELDTRFDWVSGQKIKGWSKEGITEDFTINGPKTFYGATKLSSEFLLQEYADNYGISSVINRCGVIAGAWQFGKVDQGIFTFWMLSHYFKRRINYIGFKGKGKQVRDLLHIDDLFELIDLQAKAMGKISGRLYNIGGGKGVSLSLLETSLLAAKITGNKINIPGILKNRPKDVAIYLTDNSKVYTDLGWKPRKTVSEILEDIYNWINENEAQLKEALV